MSIIAYFFWGILLAFVLFGVFFDKLFPNRANFIEDQNKSTNQQLNENAALNQKSTNEIGSTFIP
ncbi:hypothetical protein [Neobacillus sp. DY30]|uniref:hypothetical protein n=1 Tax=Neobacillus sp. DY30 TaxID=3047871 RepID=UPI0024C09ED7|nr:hypothetical protein [Neobacillus sp. DY30]WHX98097.1 hypothetical protein QNH29_15610 [Neobacillus sp. DY30]